MRMLEKPDESLVAFSNALVEYSGNTNFDTHNYKENDRLLVDSDASCHVANDKYLFNSMTHLNLKPSIHLPDDLFVILNSRVESRFLSKSL